MKRNRQPACRGDVLLCGKYPVLVVALLDCGAYVVRLAERGQTHHRADIILPVCGNAKNTVARCSELFAISPLQIVLAKKSATPVVIPEHEMRRVDAALIRERDARIAERLPSGAIRSNWPEPKWGDRGRKIGRVSAS